MFMSAVLGRLLYASKVRVWFREDLTRIQTFANRCIRYMVYAKRRGGFRQLREKLWRMTDLYELTGVKMMEVYIMRRTLSYLSSLVQVRQRQVGKFRCWEQNLKQEAETKGRKKN